MHAHAHTHTLLRQTCVQRMRHLSIVSPPPNRSGGAADAAEPVAAKADVVDSGGKGGMFITVAGFADSHGHLL